MKIISAQVLVPVSSQLLVDGAIAIEGGEIIDVGREEDLLKRYPDAIHENYPNHVILPGLINSHVHLDMSLYQNFSSDPVSHMGTDIDYVNWLLGVLEYKKRVDPMQLREAVERGIDESLEAGTTCVAEMGNYEGIFNVIEQKNIRAVVFPEVMSLDSSISKDLYESAMAIVEKYQEEISDLISVGIGPYSPYLLSRNILRIMSQFCQSSGLPLMIHAANSFDEMQLFNDSTGKIAEKLFPSVGWDDLPPAHYRTPIQHLSEIGFLGCQPILVGCTQTTDTDLDLIARSGSKVVMAVRAGDYLNQGQPDIVKILERKIICALATDGIPSVDTLSLWDEMRAFMARFRDIMPITGHQILSMVTTHAAMALGLQEEIGSLEKGKKADFLIVDMTGVSTEGDFILNLIEYVQNYHIHQVVINGEVVKSLN